MNSIFFDSNTFFIDKKSNHFKYESYFRVFNENGNHVGFIIEEVTSLQKILSHFLNKNILPFRFQIKDCKGNLQSSVFKAWTLLGSPIIIKNDQNITIGYVKRKPKVFNLVFKIYNQNNLVIASVMDSFSNYSLHIVDATGKVIGKFNEKWDGELSGFFSTADKSILSLKTNAMDFSSKCMLLSGALIIDKILK